MQPSCVTNQAGRDTSLYQIGYDSDFLVDMILRPTGKFLMTYQRSEKLKFLAFYRFLLRSRRTTKQQNKPLSIQREQKVLLVKFLLHAGGGGGFFWLPCIRILKPDYFLIGIHNSALHLNPSQKVFCFFLRQ